MKTTVIITVKSPSGYYNKDIRVNICASNLIQAISNYIANGYEIIALEEFDGDIEDFYNKTLTDDDIDAMAADIPA